MGRRLGDPTGRVAATPVRAQDGSRRQAPVAGCNVPAGASPCGATGGQRSSIMNVGRRVDYALRALCYLAAQPGERVVPRAEIQERQGIPPHFLSKILRSLVAAGFLRSVPGARGGFRLGRPARQISVRAVYESVEGRLSLIDCVDGRDASCRFADVCTQIEIWRGAQTMLGSYLDRITIGDIADQHGLVPRLRQRSMRQVAARG